MYRAKKDGTNTACDLECERITNNQSRTSPARMEAPMGPLINSSISRKGGTEWVDYQEHELEAERLIMSNTLYIYQHSMIHTFQIQPRGLCGLPITITFYMRRSPTVKKCGKLRCTESMASEIDSGRRPRCLLPRMRTAQHTRYRRSATCGTT